MTDIRIWHHGLDQYHAAFRMIRLLSYYESICSLGDSLPVSKLKILDMFFAYPSLLHRLSYSRDDRKVFVNLAIPKPEKSFVNIPSNPALSRSMESSQRAALSDLAARGIVNKEKFLIDQVSLHQERINEKLLEAVIAANNEDNVFLSFLMGTLGEMKLNGPNNIFRATQIHRSFT